MIAALSLRQLDLFALRIGNLLLAGYGQFTYDISSKFSATVGLRYGAEHKTVMDGEQFDLARV
jgi:hypothetical protein